MVHVLEVYSCHTIISMRNSLVSQKTSTDDLALVAKYKEGWSKKKQFEPRRKEERNDDWQGKYGISMSQLEELRANAIKKLESFRQDCPDLVDYFIAIIRQCIPGDKFFFFLLHCALQWSRAHISANCGANWCHSNPAALKDSCCSTLIALDAISGYFQPFSSFVMGYVADAIGCINGRQGHCPSEGIEFTNCPPLQDTESDPDVVVNVLSIAFEFFDSANIRAFLLSAAGTTTQVNERILRKLNHCNSSNVTICPTEMNHAQYFRGPFPKQTLLSTSIKMSSDLRAVSELLQFHFEKKCEHVPDTTLFQYASDNGNLPMISGDPNVSVASFKGMVKSSQSRRDAIIAHCRTDPNALALDGPIEVKTYAHQNFAEIRSREQAHNENGRRDLPAPQSIGQVRCGHILSNMGTNSWKVQESKVGTEEMKKRMSAVASAPRKKRPTKKKSDAEDNSEFEKLKRKLCTDPGCERTAQKGGKCYRHGAKIKRCTDPGCERTAQKGGKCYRHGGK